MTAWPVGAGPFATPTLVGGSLTAEAASASQQLGDLEGQVE